MEKFVAIFIALLLIFGYGTGGLPDGDFGMPDEPEVEEEQVTGRQSRDIREEDGIYREFHGQIAGNASIDLETENGNIYVRFEEQIAGTASVNLTARRGDIYVHFGDEVTGNASVNINAPNGRVIFANQSSTIQDYISRGNLDVSAGIEIDYITGPIF